MSEVVVLRMGHRVWRDMRITTHVGLVARAFGARGMLLVGRNRKIEKSIEKVNELWGGDFFVRCGVSWRDVIREWKRQGGVVVHLTMYGKPLDRVIPTLRGKRILLVVGAEKVPAEIFSLADFNVAIGNQPHSEVAAVSVFLDRLFGGRELEREFTGWKFKVVPSEKGKKVVRNVKTC